MLNESEKRLHAAVDEARLVRTCRELVRIPSVNPYSGDKTPSGETACLAHVEKLCRELGGEIVRVPCSDELCEAHGIGFPHGRANTGRESVLAKFVFGSGRGPVFALDAHIDTVAVDNYRGDPFSGELREGFIHGRGSSDDKSGAAIMLETIRVLKDHPAGLDGTLYLCFVTEEECDGSGRGSIACIAAMPKPDGAIVLDGNYGAVRPGSSGILTVRVEVPGKSGHAAYGAVSAIAQALKLQPAFEAFKAARPDEPGMLNWGVFRAGDHPANVPDKAELGLNLRTLASDADEAFARYGKRSGRTVRELFESCIANVAAQDPFLKEHPPRIVWIKDLPGEVDDAWAGDFIALVRDAWADATAETPAVEPLCGWGDITHFIRAGIPSVGMGASWPGAAHAAEEKVRVSDLVHTAQAVAVAAARFLRRR